MKEMKIKKTNPFCTLVVARWSSFKFSKDFRHFRDLGESRHSRDNNFGESRDSRQPPPECGKARRIRPSYRDFRECRENLVTVDLDPPTPPNFPKFALFCAFQFEPQSTNSKNVNLRKTWRFRRFQKEHPQVWKSHWRCAISNHYDLKSLHFRSAISSVGNLST